MTESRQNALKFVLVPDGVILREVNHVKEKYLPRLLVMSNLVPLREFHSILLLDSNVPTNLSTGLNLNPSHRSTFAEI